MLFDFATDCHIDTWDKELDWSKYQNKSIDTLVITGDMSNSISLTLKSLKQAKKYYKTVIFVDGNHDWWNLTVGPNQGYPILAKSLTDLGITFLNCSSFQINNTLFIGANGWYDFSLFGTSEKAKVLWNSDIGSNDSHMIIWDLEPEQLCHIQAKKVSNIVQKANNDNSVKTIVMLSHIAPLAKLAGNHGFPAGYNLLDNAYASETMSNKVFAVDYYNKIKIWCYGHTHTRLDKIINNIRYINNGRGYQQEITNKWNLLTINTEDTEKNRWDCFI